jgi:hypothetical protein
MKEKFIIVDLINKDFMKDKDGIVLTYDTEMEASEVCGFYEFKNVWICKLVYNYID